MRIMRKIKITIL